MSRRRPSSFLVELVGRHVTNLFDALKVLISDAGRGVLADFGLAAHVQRPKMDEVVDEKWTKWTECGRKRDEKKKVDEVDEVEAMRNRKKKVDEVGKARKRARKRESKRERES